MTLHRNPNKEVIEMHFFLITRVWVFNYVKKSLSSGLHSYCIAELTLGTDGTFDVNMTSSEVVCTHHNIRRFIRRSLVLKIKPSTGQTLGTTDKIERRRNMAKSEGRALLTIETLKTFYCCIEKPLCGMNPTNSVTKL